MDKFLIRPAGTSPAVAKRPATATPPGTAAGKKAKSSSVANKSAAWAKVRMIPVPGAEYQDQTLLFTTLKDGRELLIGEEVWALPTGASAASPAGLKTLEQVGKVAGDRFAPLPGLDAVAVVIGSGFGSTPPRLSLRSLPTGAEEIIADVPLPGIGADRNYGGSGFIKRVHAAAVPNDPGAASLLVCTDSRLFSFTVRETGGAEKLTCTLDASVDLASGPLAAALGGPGKLQASALYSSPEGRRFALCGRDGEVHVIALESDAAKPARSVTMHTPLKKTDRDAHVFGLALWRDGAAGCKMVTVGSDGTVAVAALDDGTALVRPSNYPDEQWHATASGSGPSKQYRFAAAHHLAVSDSLGLAVTGSQWESVAHVWDLRSTKTSAKGKQVCTTPRLAAGNPNKVKIMCLAASSSASCLFAQSNSNNDDDATLKLIAPCGAAK
jgi:hypothetical protein